MSLHSNKALETSVKLHNDQRYRVFNFHHNELMDTLGSWIVTDSVKPMLLAANQATENNAGLGREFALQASCYQQQLAGKSFQVLPINVDLLDLSATEVIASLEKTSQLSQQQKALWNEVKQYCSNVQLENDSAKLGFTIVLQVGLFASLGQLLWDRLRNLQTRTLTQSLEEFLTHFFREACQKNHLVLHIDHAEASIHSAKLFLKIADTLNNEARENPAQGRCLLALNCQNAAQFANYLRLNPEEYQSLNFAALSLSDLEVILPQRDIQLSESVLELIATHSDEEHHLYPADLEKLFVSLQQADLLVATKEGYQIKPDTPDSAILSCLGQPVRTTYEAGIAAIEDETLWPYIKRYMALVGLCGEHYIPQIPLLYCLGLNYHNNPQDEDLGDRIIDALDDHFCDVKPQLLQEHSNVMLDSEGQSLYCYTLRHPVLSNYLTRHWSSEEKTEQAKQLLQQLASLLPHANHARNSLLWHLAQKVGGDVQEQWFTELYHHVMAAYSPIYQQSLQQSLATGKTNALIVLRHAMNKRHYPAYDAYLSATLKACQPHLNHSDLQTFLGDFKGKAKDFWKTSRYQASLSVLQRLELLADQLEFDAELSELYYIRGANQHSLGNYDAALNWLAKALTIREKLNKRLEVDSNQDNLKGNILNSMGTTYHSLGDYDTALQYLQQSRAIKQEIGDKSGEGKILNNISQIYDTRGDYETALKYLQQSLAIHQEISDKDGEGTTLNNIATTAHARGDYETALKYLQQSLAIHQEIGDKSGEGTTLNNMATTAHARGDYDTALKYLQQALAIRQEIGDKSGEGTTLNNMATTAHARGDYETALKYLQQALAIRQEIGDVAGLCGTTINIGHIHWQNEQQKEALLCWTQGYRIAKQIDLAQALQALESMAEQLNLPSGLDGWEAIAQKMENEA